VKYPYTTQYFPPFPTLQVSLYNPEEALRTAVTNALIDTGADGTLVPLIYLRQIVAPVLTAARIRSHWGEWRMAQMFLVDIELADMVLPGMFVVGDELGNALVLGRDVLNRLPLLLNGPELYTVLR